MSGAGQPTPPAYGTVVYRRDNWIREAKHIVHAHGRPVVESELALLYNEMLKIAVKGAFSHDELQVYLRQGLHFLDYVADQFFPTEEEMDGTTRRERRHARKEARTTDILSALKFIDLPPGSETPPEVAASVLAVEAGPEERLPDHGGEMSTADAVARLEAIRRMREADRAANQSVPVIGAPAPPSTTAK